MSSVRYLGTVDAADRSEVLGGAHALLHLIDFDEPFGYSVVEAMACGTPVIAYDRGSMGELIDHEATGFLVDDLDGATRAIDLAGHVDRQRDPCRHGETVQRVDDGRPVRLGVSSGPGNTRAPSGRRDRRAVIGVHGTSEPRLPACCSHL